MGAPNSRDVQDSPAPACQASDASRTRATSGRLVRPPRGLALALAAVAGAALATSIGAVIFLCHAAADSSGAEARHTTVRSTPGVVAAMRDMAKLDTTNFHIEKVIEARDEQSRLWGLIQPKDAVLLVAVGDVVAGVDLSKLRDEDVRVEPSSAGQGARVQVRLPAPEIVSSSLDERSTHVVLRSTDMLAERNEQLEGEARRQAEEQMRQAAVDAGILERARASADRTLRALLRSVGYEQVDLVYSDRAAREGL